MSKINTGLWVRIQNDEVAAVWDSEPSFQTEAGWREAIEIIPDITPNREHVTDHYFDLTKTPVEIIWNKVTLTLEDRRNNLSGNARAKYQEIVQGEIRKHGDLDSATVYDVAVIDTAKTELETKLAAIAAAQTDEELDLLY